MSKFFASVGKRVRFYRKAAQLSQEELGALLNIDQSYLGKIERGEVNITLETIQKISEVLKIYPYQLFEVVEERTNKEKNEVLNKIELLLVNLKIDELKTIYRIIKDILLFK
ncbi:helix-turn-helix transcriptional regulator [Paenibacillus chondroitinus]|uniref:Helix-turn-helix transcriptional regulator n=1 Tax=Paenibacillus chondroitinus TaxID=59842 RepID=A0ABU6D9Q2_9BACL|nr:MULTISPECIES: helix-turn-helix transcriptional regulator [Paenibacillus]MCY9661970.1 helix-turn-helix domain-containing protein [Paenibacillus anseongense]MEB4793656.1 helix-turn-helix transcriptional regulator [Paenibacillus chondroitinus]